MKPILYLVKPDHSLITYESICNEKIDQIPHSVLRTCTYQQTGLLLVGVYDVYRWWVVCTLCTPLYTDNQQHSPS